MRQFDTLSSMLENSTSLYSQYVHDPILTLTFSAILSSAGVGLSTTAISTVASIAAAITTTGIADTAYFGGKP